MTEGNWSVPDVDSERSVFADIAMKPQVSSPPTGPGIQFEDRVEEVRSVLYTDATVSPTPVTGEGFVFPADRLVEFTTRRLETSRLIDIWVRDDTGTILAKFDGDNPDPVSLPPGDYYCDLPSLALKIYVRVSGASVHIERTETSVTIDFGADTTIQVGARLLHDQPTETIATTSAPDDLMAAISRFGNAMKTFSPERTFPTLRGHPPLLEIDEDASAGFDTEPPASSVRLTVPAEYGWIYPAVSVAYWLGATLEPGDPALHVAGEPYPLDGETASRDRRAFERQLRELLQGTFLLDCAARTEGFYEVDLDARRHVEAAGYDLDFEAIYRLSLADRLATYLEVAPSMADLLDATGQPEWRFTADVQPDAQRASILPFLARDLAVIRCPTDDHIHQVQASQQDPSHGASTDGDASAPRKAETQPTRGGFDQSGAGSRVGTATGMPDTRPGTTVVSLPEADTPLQAWAGEGFAASAANVTTASYLRRLESHASDDDHHRIDVVVNDEQTMLEEAVVSDIYGDRDCFQFDISIHRRLSQAALADVFEADTDFVHYIGHVDERGFDCSDGYLDVGQLGEVGVDTFVLNACASYDQGVRLVDRGAIAGIVTVEDLVSPVATRIGKELAWLLTYGFSIETATKLVRETMAMGDRYAVVGDSTASLAQSDMPVPNIKRIHLTSEGRFQVEIETFSSWRYDTGAMYSPYVPGCDHYYTVPGGCDTWALDRDELADLLELATFPIVAAKKLYWSNETSADELYERLAEYESM